MKLKLNNKINIIMNDININKKIDKNNKIKLSDIKSDIIYYNFLMDLKYNGDSFNDIPYNEIDLNILSNEFNIDLNEFDSEEYDSLRDWLIELAKKQQNDTYYNEVFVLEEDFNKDNITYYLTDNGYVIYNENSGIFVEFLHKLEIMS